MKVRFLPILCTTLIAVAGCGGGVTQGDGDAVPAGQEDVFAARIVPIMQSSCGCHVGGASDGGVALGSYAAAVGQVVVGDAGASPLLVSMGLVDGVNGYYDPGEAEVIRSWIEAGAPRFGEAGSYAGSGESGYAGISSCANHCHALAREEWLGGPHGNLEEMDESHQDKGLGLDSLGFPVYGYYGLGEEGSSCSAVCHDPQGDGQALAAGLTGNVPRPVVGCEACHGAGGDHLAIDFPEPDAERCGVCHNQAFDHNRYHPEGDDIIEGYRTSPHARSLNDHVFAGDSESDVRALCSKCHSDEGAQLYRDVQGGHDELADAFTEGQAPIAAATPVQCRTCHDAHDPDQLLLVDQVELVDGDETVVASAEFRTCTNCHQVEDGYHGENSGYSWGGGYPDFPLEVGAFDPGSINYDTHYDDPITTDIEGYIIDPSDPRACRNCHNPHAADNTVNGQWARSGHGGRLLLAKEQAAEAEGPGAAEAIYAAAATDELAPAWVHYDFKEQTGGRTGTGRQDCQMCHTTTGLIAYTADPTGYDPADNDFSWIGEGVPDDFVPDLDDPELGDNRKELLYCQGCHSDNAGSVRDPGPLTVNYADAPVVYDDLGPSNLCLVCHTGRAAGGSLAHSGADFSNARFINSHYLAAGGTLFASIGYEYAGRDYANVAYYKHDYIGLQSEDGEEEETIDTGSGGPCVGCHLGSEDGEPANHRFLPFAYAADGVITGLVNPLCAACHKPSEHRDTTLTAEFLEEEKEHYEDAIHALEVQLEQAGYPYLGAYPYFGGTNWLSDSDGDGVTRIDSDDDGELDAADPDDAWTGPHNMGAAFNFNLLHHEPGGYAHNRYYVKRLIYDSIDWLDNNSLDDSVATTLDALDEDAPYKAGAITYLANIGR